MAVIQRRTRTILSLTTTLYIIGLIIGSKSVRNTVTSIFSPRTHPLRLAALLTTLILNFKSLPLVWHIRLFGPMNYLLFLQPKPLPQDALFRPLITKGARTSLLETDYNLHKSNSTYFADLDIGRMMFLSCLLRKGIRQSSKYQSAGKADVDDALAEGRTFKRRRSSVPGVDGLRAAAEKASEIATAETTLRTPHAGDEPVPATTSDTRHPETKASDRFLIALGGISCQFKRELKPYEEYEIWTRVLSWDRKWIYLVQHMVKAGAVRPDEYALGRSRSWGEIIFNSSKQRRDRNRKSTSGKGSKEALRQLQREKEEAWQKAIFASSVSKYVVKKGRLTIPPEVVWKRSDLLPTEGPEAGDEQEGPFAWTSANVERERQRGGKLAQNFAALDGLVDEFPTMWDMDDGEDHGKKLKVLGSFQDWLVF